MIFFLLRWWVPFVVAAGSALAILSLGPAHDAIWDHPTAAFATVLALTVGCAVGAAVVVWLGAARRLPEVALLGASLWVVSLLPVAHGLLLEGHL